MSARHGAPRTHWTNSAASPRQQVTARHNRWVWSSGLVIVFACVIAVVVGVDVGAFVLAGLLAVCGAGRLVTPGQGPAGITIRSRTLDVAMFWLLSAGIVLLALTAPL